ncbi:MAG TPA: hypothetical protein VIC34_07360 [Croceibacterium sp.]|jgi:hypothetical protein
MSTAVKVWLALGLGAAVIGVGIFFLARNPDLTKCDEAIQATLKAPSTYKRVNSQGSSGSYIIDYDAANSFGVMLRGSGICTVTNGQALWLETSEPPAYPG